MKRYGMLLAWAAGFGLIGATAHAQQIVWGEDQDVSITYSWPDYTYVTSPVSARSLTVAGEDFATSGVVMVWGEEAEKSPFGFQTSPHITIGEGGLHVADEGSIGIGFRNYPLPPTFHSLEEIYQALLADPLGFQEQFGDLASASLSAGWVDSVGGVTMNGGQIGVFDTLSTGWSNTPRFSTPTGTFTATGGSLVVGSMGKIYTGKFSYMDQYTASGEVGVYDEVLLADGAWVQAGESLSIQSYSTEFMKWIDSGFRVADILGRDVSFGGVNTTKLISPTGVQLGGAVTFSEDYTMDAVQGGHISFGGSPQFVSVIESLRVQSGNADTYDIRVDQVKPGTVTVTNDLALLGGLHGTSNMVGFAAARMGINSGITLTSGGLGSDFLEDGIAPGMEEWEEFSAMMEETFNDPELLAAWRDSYDEMVQMDDFGQMARFFESKGVDFRNGEMPSADIWAQWVEMMSGAALPDAYMATFTSNVGITGNLHFNKNAKLVVKGGDTTLVSYKPGADATGEGWTFADGLAMEDHLFDARITAADGAKALIDIRRMGRLRIGYTADMGLWDAQNTTAYLSGGTLTLEAPTTFLFDYTRVTGGVDTFEFDDESHSIIVDKAPQVILGKGGRLVGGDKLTLGINGDTAPANLVINGPPVHAVFIGSEWRYDTALSEGDRIANATADLNALNLATGYQYGLFKIEQVGVENLALTTTTTDLSGIYGDDYGVINYDPQAVSEQTDAYITGMVTKIKADDVIDPGVTDKGINATADIKKLFDDYVPGSNPFIDPLYANLVDNPVDAYVGLASGLFADAAVGGAAIAFQSARRARAAALHRLSAHENPEDPHVARLPAATDAFALLQRPHSETPWRDGWALWAVPLYAHERGQNLRLGGVPAAFHADLGGASLGLDLTTHDQRFRFGFAGHLGGGRAQSSAALLRAKNDFTFGGVELFAGARFGDLTLALDAGWSRNANEINMAGLHKSAYDTDVLSARLGLEYTFHLGDVDITPGFAVEYVHLRQDRYRLHVGGATAFTSARGSADVVNLPLRVRVHRDFALRCGTFTPEIKGSWTPSVNDTGLRHRVHVPGTAGYVNAASPMADRHTGEIGAAVKYEQGRYSAGLEYDYRFSHHFRSHNVNAFFGIHF